MKQTFKDWAEIVKRVELDLSKARETSVGVAIAIECQELTLKYCEKRRDSFPKPKVMMEEEEKKQEEEVKEEEEAKE